jgi:hypothetical protein
MGVKKARKRNQGGDQKGNAKKQKENTANRADTKKE